MRRKVNTRCRTLSRLLRSKIALGNAFGVLANEHGIARIVAARAGSRPVLSTRLSCRYLPLLLGLHGGIQRAVLGVLFVVEM
jgi:hypothetical protein